MQKVINPLLTAVKSFALGNFIVMVRESQILATRMYVQALTKQVTAQHSPLHDHHHHQHHNQMIKHDTPQINVAVSIDSDTNDCSSWSSIETSAGNTNDHVALACLHIPW
jgi:hypothetical protein